MRTSSITPRPARPAVVVGLLHDGVSIAIHGRFGDEHVGVLEQVISTVATRPPLVHRVVLDLRGARECSHGALTLVATLIDRGARVVQDPVPLSDVGAAPATTEAGTTFAEPPLASTVCP